MIKLENAVFPSPEQMAFIIQGMRNPMNSWHMSDSIVWEGDEGEEIDILLGEKDKKLMANLSRAGNEHRKYARMMNAYVRITAPLYWWKEFDTYKVGTVANSCSTMHKITEHKFTILDFSIDHLDDNIGCHEVDPGDIMFSWKETSLDIMYNVIEALNVWREKYLEAIKKEDDGEMNSKDIWWQLIQLLPSSYNQTRNVCITYEALINMYKQRYAHKLDEWRKFCKWIETVPYFEEVIKPALPEFLKLVKGGF